MFLGNRGHGQRGRGTREGARARGGARPEPSRECSEPEGDGTWLPAATGGGPSAVYPLPDWQSGVDSIIGTNARGVPDLSWNTAVNGGVLVWITAFPNAQRPGWHVYGGTSAASPQVAGLLALANEQQADAGEQPLGLLDLLLYQVGSGPAFGDIVPVTEGTAESGVLKDSTLWQLNADGSVSPGPVPGGPKLAGWDLTTGFGSPRAASFVAAVRAARNAPQQTPRAGSRGGEDGRRGSPPPFNQQSVSLCPDACCHGSAAIMRLDTSSSQPTSAWVCGSRR